MSKATSTKTGKKWRTVECPNGHKWTGSGATPPAVRCPKCGKQWVQKMWPKVPGLTRRNPGKKYVSLTYGQLPKRAVFISHFDAHVPEGNYEMKIQGKHTPLVSPGLYDSAEMWDLVTTLADAFHGGDNDAGDWASTILETLGIEWM